MSPFNSVPAWQIFVALGALLIVAEIFVPGFVMLPIGIACLITSAVAAALPTAIAGWTSLLGVLAVSLVAMFGVFHGPLKKYHSKTRVYTGAEGMVGAECVVTETIEPGGMGYVKLYGDRWQARSFSENALKEGTRVIITKIDGNKVIVEPLA